MARVVVAGLGLTSEPLKKRPSSVSVPAPFQRTEEGNVQKYSPWRASHLSTQKTSLDFSQQTCHRDDKVEQKPVGANAGTPEYRHSGWVWVE